MCNTNFGKITAGGRVCKGQKGNVHNNLFSSDIFFSTTETMILNQKSKGFGERCMGVFIDKVLSDSNSDSPCPPPLQQYRTIAHTPTRIFQFPSYSLLEYLSLYSLEEYFKLLIPGKKALLRWNGGSEFKSS